MEWSIITDSSCNLDAENINSESIKFEKVPFSITFENKEYLDDDKIVIKELLESIETNSPSKTACAPVGAWASHFKDSTNIIAVTISSSLSGSYNSALSAKNLILEKNPEKNIVVIDSKSAGAALDLLVLKATELIDKQYSFDKIESVLEKYAKELHTIFALSSFNNLVSNGRMSKITALLAGKLSIWGIGIANEEGKISIKKKTRGKLKVIKYFIEELEEKNFHSGPIIINHCKNYDLALRIKLKILHTWKDASVNISPMGGICSYYAERDGIIVSF